MKLILKLISSLLVLRRSREGAWIEISLFTPYEPSSNRRSREGAWIEIIIGGALSNSAESLPRGSVD